MSIPTRLVLPYVVAAVVTSCAIASHAAQPDAASTARGDRWHAAYLRQRTEAIEAACLKDIDTLEKWKARERTDREALFDMLGLNPLPDKTDLKATVTGKVEREKFTVEKVHFQSRPQLYVTGNLYLPKGLDKPAPAILYLCGHGAVKKGDTSYGNKVTYQHHGAWFAEHGYVCFIIDSLQLGEIEGIHHGTHRYNMWWWNAVGYTPAGVEAWNCIRALDYLESRPEVNRERMGATGRSGGGAYSWWIAALDERIKAAAPVAGITDLRNHVIDGVVEGHCDCMYISNGKQWDYANVVAIVAPRPLLIANSDSDRIFPLDGVLRVYEKTRAIYKLYGAADKLGLQISPGPHKDTQELQMAAFKFFDKHLRGEERVIGRAATKQFEPEELKVFETLPADQKNTTIQETFTHQFEPPVAPKSSGQWAALRRQGGQALQKVFGYWPREFAGNVPPRVVFSELQDGVRLTGYELTVHEGLTLPLFQLELAARERESSAELEVLDDAAWQKFLTALAVKFATPLEAYRPPSRDEAAWASVKERLEKRDLFFFAPRNHGPTATNADTRPQTQLRRRYMLLGESLEGMQTWDVLRATQTIGSIGERSGRELHVRAKGDLAAAALYASLRQGLPVSLELISPPASHHTGAPLFHVLRHLDMPQAVALAAERSPVKLLDVNENDWRFAIDTFKNMQWHNRLTIENSDIAEK
ncbi:MAG TPA: prolyl oligopeptidase family serine peptidase [Pirellulales bacterium]|nr:prolyl oligopeptidase family serine peptidase [Pirellulales bacterium]